MIGNVSHHTCPSSGLAERKVTLILGDGCVMSKMFLCKSVFVLIIIPLLQLHGAYTFIVKAKDRIRA